MLDWTKHTEELVKTWTEAQQKMANADYITGQQINIDGIYM